MNSAPIHSGQRIQAAPRWFAAVDIALAVCAAVFAVSLPWTVYPQYVGFGASLFFLLIAAAFIIASAALKRGWSGRWPLQLVGPALALYFLFGLSFTLAWSILGAVLGGLALRWTEHHDS